MLLLLVCVYMYQTTGHKKFILSEDIDYSDLAERAQRVQPQSGYQNRDLQ